MKKLKYDNGGDLSKATKKPATKKPTTSTAISSEDIKAAGLSSNLPYIPEDTDAVGTPSKVRRRNFLLVGKDDYKEGVDVLKDAEKARAYTMNWVKNRKVQDPTIQAEIDKTKKAKLDGLSKTYISVVKGDANSGLIGEYVPSRNKIELDKNLSQLDENKTTAIHEFRHGADRLSGLDGGLSEREIELLQKNSSPYNKLSPEMYQNKAYLYKPTEQAARIQALRYTYDLKPDEVVTPELLKQKRTNYFKKNKTVSNDVKQAETMFEGDKLIEVLNKLSKNETKDDGLRKAALGGEVTDSLMGVGDMLGGAASMNPYVMAAKAGSALINKGADAVLANQTDEDGLLENNASSAIGLGIKNTLSPVKQIGNIVDAVSNIGKESPLKTIGRIFGQGQRYDDQKKKVGLYAERKQENTRIGNSKYLDSDRFGSGTQLYEVGGKVVPEYNAEDGEIVIGKPKVFKGGKIKYIGKNMYEIDGKKHEEGGVDMAGGKFIISDSEKLEVGGKTPADLVRDGNNVTDVIKLQEGMKSKKKMAYGGLPDPNKLGIMSLLPNNTIDPIPVQTPVVNAKIGVTGNKMPNIDTSTLVDESTNPLNRIKDLIKNPTATGMADTVLSNVDILGNAVINSKARNRAIPRMSKQRFVRANKVSADSQITDINNSVKDTQTALEAASSQNTAASKLQALASGVGAKSKVMESVNNANTEIQNRNNLVNADIEKQNNMVDYENKMTNYKIQDDLDQRSSQNIAKAVERRNIQKQDNAKSKLTRLQQLVQLASSDPRSVDYLFSRIEDGTLTDQLDKFEGRKEMGGKVKRKRYV